MANKIILKRGADGNVSSLTPVSIGEPIWGTTSNKFYVASGTSAGNFEWVGAPILDEDAMGSDSATSLATQQSIKAYVTSQVTAQDLDFSTDTGSGGTVDLDSQALAFTSGEGINITHSGQAVTFACEDATVSNKGVASFATADFTVSSGAVSIASIANSQIDNSNIAVTDGTTSSNIALGATLTFTDVDNETEVTQSGGTVTIGLPNDVTIGGDLTVNGTTTTVESTTVSTADVMIELAKDNDSADSVDFGMYGKYNDGSTTRYSGWFRNQDGTFTGAGTTYTDAITFYQEYSKEAPGTTSSLIDTSHGSYALAPIECSAVNGATLDGGTF